MSEVSDEDLARHSLRSLFQAAATASRENRDEEAEEIYRRILTYVPGDPVARYNLATTLLRQGKYEEGWPLYEARAELGTASVVKPVAKTA